MLWPDDTHPGYATAAVVAKSFGVDKPRVYRLANRYAWRRYWLDDRVRYHIDDVVNTFAYLADPKSGRSASGQFTAGGR